jgi:hypothetical protein
MPGQQTFTVPSTGVFRSADGTKNVNYTQNDVIPMETAVELQMTGAYLATEQLPTTNNNRLGTFAATATATGATTGTVPLGTDFVTVTSANANNIVILPDAPVGTRIRLQNGATGYELRSHAPATVGLNGGVGAAAESAVAASLLVEVIRTTATNWVGSTKTAAGVVAVLEVAAP